MIGERFQQPAAPVTGTLAPAPAERPRRWYPAALTSLAWHALLLAGAGFVLGIGTDRSSAAALYLFVVLVVPALLISLLISALLCLLVRSRHRALLGFHGTWTTGAGLLGAVIVMTIAYQVRSSTRG